MNEFWDQVYSQNPDAYGLTPNSFFAECLDTLKPGKILLPGDGTGRNAIYAARSGWQVTAFDASPVAVKQARAHFKAENLAVTFSEDCYETFPVQKQAFDALAFSFTHIHNDQRRSIHKRLSAGVRVGGAVIAEYYHRDQLELGTGGPKNLEMLYELGDLVQDFDDFELEIQSHQRVMKAEGDMHQGPSSVLRIFGRKV